jgi:hypothetical protein
MDHPVKIRSRRFPLVLLGILAFAGIAAHAAYTTLYNRVLDKPELSHLEVEEVPGTQPLQLRIKVKAINDWQDIRSVTTKSRGNAMSVVYHLSLPSLAKPGVSWQEPYVLSIPDSIDEVWFGHHKAKIWQRSKRD